MRRILAQTTFIFLLLAGSAVAAAQFPALTGRVVDNAQIISPEVRQILTQKLDEYERGTTNQVVVFTAASLEGEPLEDYTNKLFRHWQLGKKGKDNGVLLLVAVKERALRIEVGYGLEGVLTDALAQQIISTIIVPNFKAGKMEQGIVDGTEAILAVLGGKGLPSADQEAGTDVSQLILLLIIFFFVAPLVMRSKRWMAGYRAKKSSSTMDVLEDIAETAIDIALIAKGSSRSDDNHRGGGSSGGGGFSGGGGSSGGGGASGRW